MITLRILELVTSRMIKLGQKLIGMHMNAPLEREKAVSWMEELVEFFSDSLTFKVSQNPEMILFSLVK